MTEFSETSQYYWEDKEVFERNKQEFIEDRIDDVKAELAEFSMPQDQLDATARIFLRARYVAQFMLEKAPIDPYVPIRAGFTSKIANKSIHGLCSPILELNGQEVTDYKNLTSDNINALKLKKIDTAINIVSLMSDVTFKFESSQEAVRDGIERQKADMWRNKALEDMGIDYEKYMVEEIAHAFYWLSAGRDPERLQKALEEMKKYPKFDITQYQLHYKHYEHQEEHDSHPMESRASIWLRSFLRKYYPESTQLRNEKYIYNELKKKRD
jgi:hypothetical protein